MPPALHTFDSLNICLPLAGPLVFIPSGNDHGTAVTCLSCLHRSLASFSLPLPSIPSHLASLNLASTQPTWLPPGLQKGSATEAEPMKTSHKAGGLGARDLFLPLPPCVVGNNLETTIQTWLFTLSFCSPFSIKSNEVLVFGRLGNDGSL